MYFQLKNVYKAFGEKKVVNNLSLELAQGELLCILGSSGCGKTTTLNMVGGFLKPDRGEILLDGQEISGLAPEQRPVTTVFQSYGLFPHMTVLQNVLYGLKFKKDLSKAERLDRAMEYIALVDLSGSEKAHPYELSGGMQQRVALARALAPQPKLCLLDEPFSNLDAALREQMRTELKRIQKTLGMTMLFVTHDQEEAMVLSDKMCIMKDGLMIQTGAPQELYTKPADPYVKEFLYLDRLMFTEQGIYKKIQ